MTTFWLLCYENLATILAVLSIILTIIVSAESLKKRAKICIGILIAFVAFIISVNSIETYNSSTIVPNIIGLTYDDAMSTLYSHRLKGQLVLASTNDNLADTDSRVVWQSRNEDTVTNNGNLISFIIDDSFALNSRFIIQYPYQDLEIDQYEALKYDCDYHDALQQMRNTDFQYGTPLNDPHWDIEIESAELEYELNVNIKYGVMHLNGETVYSYEVYAKSMAATMEKIIEDSAEMLGRSLKYNLNNCVIIGKIIPLFEHEDSVLLSKDFENYQEKGNSILLLPQTMKCGNYKFAFSIICSDGQMFEWYHNLKIVDNDSSS